MASFGVLVVRRVGRSVAAAIATAIIAVSLTATPSAARGPENIADVAEKVIAAVVNISTSQNVNVRGPNRRVPPGRGLDDFFDDFFNKRGDNPNGDRPDRERTPRRVSSLGSGFIIDPSGLVVTNNHVISGADEVSVILNDGTKLKAEIIGRDTKTDLALLKVNSAKPLTAVKFGDSDKLRLGEWVIAIGNPFGLGGTITAGIVSARNRDINSGPYDNYIQTDAAINRGNSGGPLFNLDGEVVGINTAIISPSGGSIGIGFAVPSRTAQVVIDQLRQYKEVRRGWLGVRIQQITDDIAESLDVKPARGALVAGVDDKGPAKPAGIEPGDVIVKFDGQDIKEMRDLPRIVATTPIGKNVDVIVIRKGKEVTKSVKIARLNDTEKPKVGDDDDTTNPDGTSRDDKRDKDLATRRALGLEFSSITNELRRRYDIKESVKGVVITDVAPNSPAAEKQLTPGDVIIEAGQQEVKTPEDLQKRLAEIKKAGRPSAVLLVAKPNGETRFVALSLK